MLSNFSKAPFTLFGHYFPLGSEQCYQLARVRFMFSGEERTRHVQELLSAPDPLACKRIGSRLSYQNPKLRAKWSNFAVSVMRRILFQKFSTNKNHRQYLLETGNRLLVEASPSDDFWGAGLAEDAVLREVQCHGRTWCPPGANWMGRLLMELRDHFTGVKPLTYSLFIGDSMIRHVEIPGCDKVCIPGAQLDHLFDVAEMVLGPYHTAVIFHGGTNNIWCPSSNPPKLESANTLARLFVRRLLCLFAAHSSPLRFLFSEVLPRHHETSPSVVRANRAVVNFNQKVAEATEVLGLQLFTVCKSHSELQSVDNFLVKNEPSLHLNPVGSAKLGKFLTQVLSAV